jgi:hypothetical protein
MFADRLPRGVGGRRATEPVASPPSAGASRRVEQRWPEGARLELGTGGHTAHPDDPDAAALRDSAVHTTGAAAYRGNSQLNPPGKGAHVARPSFTLNGWKLNLYPLWSVLVTFHRP